MEKIKVNKSELLAKLQENRDIHEEEYTEALEGWKVKVEEGFVNTLANIQRGDFSDLSPTKDLPKPQHHLKDYNLAIRMLEMSVDEHIEIEQHEFNQYVMDEWNWKAGFAMTNSSYLG